MTRPLHVLLVEDSRLDAAILLGQLQHAGWTPTSERVETATAMRAALSQQRWDVIMCDWFLPSFSAPEALAVLKDSGLDVPFIIVSGQIDDEAAVTAMKAGAHDFITKGKLARLGPAVERELREAEERSSRRRAEQALRTSEADLRARAARFRLLVEIGRELTTPHSMDELLRLMLERATVFTGCDSGSVLLLSGLDGPLRVSASVGAGAPPGVQVDDLSASVAGRALRQRQPLVLYGQGEEIGTDWRAYTKPIPTSVCLPLVTTAGRAVGVLALSSTREVWRIDDDDLETLQLLAAQLSAAIESVQLHERLQDLVGRLLLAHEEERRRVAYDIHDGLAQVAVGSQQHLEAFASNYRPRSPRAQLQLERARDLARHTVQEARRVIAGLRPTALDDFGLAAALRIEIEVLRAAGLELTFDDRLGGARLPPAVETALFRIAQEALTNVRKHARAARAHVGLEYQGDVVRLEVRDWGSGFQASAEAGPASPGERVGLAGMRWRAELLGGRFGVHSQPGEGTQVVIELPLPPSLERSGNGVSPRSPATGG